MLDHPPSLTVYKELSAMTIYSLYVKTHIITGLKYLGFTKSVDPHKYTGSGEYWIPHLKIHGYKYTTEIIHECQTKEEVKEWGLYYSNLWDIVNSRDQNGKKVWANLKPETGDGVDSETARLQNLKRVEKGTHLFLDSRFHRKNNLKRIADGTHNMSGGRLVRKQLEDGTHPSQIKWACEHCGKIGKGSTNYKRWHGIKCSKKI